MAIYIDWGQRIIHVPKADTVLVQSSPIEIRSLDLNWFRYQLLDLQDDEVGMAYPNTHQHNTEVTVSGITLARVIEIINGYTVTFEDGQYAVNLIGANSNVGDVINVNQVSVRSTNSAGLVSSQAIEFGEYGGGVTLDAINGEAGSIYPIGTERRPVNNIVDAMVIAQARGFKKIFVKGDFTFGSDAYIQDMEIIGESTLQTHLNFDSSATCQNIIVRDSEVTGTLDGGSYIRECIVNNLIYVNGYIISCGLRGTIYLDGGADGILNGCYTIDQDNPPIIDMGGSGQDVAVNNFSGIVSFQNMDSSTNEIGVGLTAGMAILMPSIVGYVPNQLVIAGVGVLMDYSGGGMGLGAPVVNTDGLMSKATVSQAVWDEPIGNHLIAGSTGASVGVAQYGGYIHISTTRGTPGTDFPQGTHSNPVDNLEDAVALATLRGLTALHIQGDFTFDATSFLQDFTIEGLGIDKQTFTFEAGSFMPYCTIKNTTVTGTLSGATGFIECILDNVGSTSAVPSTQDLYIERCLFNGTMSVPDNYGGTIKVINSYSDIPGGSTPTIDMGDSSASIFLRNYTGGIAFDNISNSASYVSVDLLAGQCVLTSNVTAGDIQIRGVGRLTDNSTGTATVNTEGLMNQNSIATAVWDEPISNHLLSGSTGLVQGISQFDGAVHISSTGTAGTTFPLGTPRTPVNNIEDAVSIAQTRGLSELHFLDDFTIDSTTFIMNYDLVGEGINQNTLTFESGAFLGYCSISSCEATGILSGATTFKDCHLNNLGSTSSVPSTEDLLIQNCLFTGSFTVPDNYGGTISILDSWSHVPGYINTPHFNMGDSSANLLVRNWAGGFTLENVTQPVAISIDINSGQMIIDSSVTNGNIGVRGVGRLVDNSTGSAVINSEGLMSIQTIASAVDQQISDLKYRIESLRDTSPMYGKVIFYDPINGNDSYDGLSEDFPVATFAQAQTIATDGAHDAIFILDTGAVNVTINEQWVITKNDLSIIGPGRDVEMIPDSTNGPSIWIQAEEIRLQGFQVRTNPTDGTNQVCVKVDPGSDNCVFEKMIIKRSQDGGLHIDNCDGVTINKCIVEHHVTSCGICIYGDSHEIYMTDNFIYDNIDGVMISDTARENVLKSNVIHDCTNAITIDSTGVGHLYIHSDNIMTNNITDIYDPYETGAVYDHDGANAQEIIDGILDDLVANRTVSGSVGKAIYDTNKYAKLIPATL